MNDEYGIVEIKGDWAMNLHRERCPCVVFPLLSIKDRSDRSLAELRTVLAGHMPTGKPCRPGNSIIIVQPRTVHWKW